MLLSLDCESLSVYARVGCGVVDEAAIAGGHTSIYFCVFIDFSFYFIVHFVRFRSRFESANITYFTATRLATAVVGPTH